ncbi:class I SAM-dependent methyltransferase [Salinactinospora qingdaonensis]|uniref:Methyltransferase domain-containing protein n=1 Tax=Salinactinospora qingdaonensis TaxID=702744 RepID=A0ABP7EXA1_9ACTN
MTATHPTTEAPLADQAKTLLQLPAGYIGYRTVALGLRSGLIEALAAAEPGGASADDLAEQLDLDPFYVGVWCRAAFGASVCERDGATYRLAPHMATLLLDVSSPAYAGGLFTVLNQPEVFDRFERTLATGERLWWDECSPEFIREVAGTGTPFYTRLVPGGLEQIPGLAQHLEAGCRVLDTACGSGTGLVRLAQTYPNCEITGVDGDAHSVEMAAERLREAGVADRVHLMVSPLEDLDLDASYTVVINNISMHECRDIDRVTDNIHRALKPGGWFVISDFPFPEDETGLRSVPGRIMSGIQFFEAQIDDQLVARSFYDGLLSRHGFTDIGSFGLAPVHAVTYGRAEQR